MSGLNLGAVNADMRVCALLIFVIIGFLHQHSLLGEELRDYLQSTRRWRLEAKGMGYAVIQSGTLTLDLTSPKRGKAAFADLQMAFELPALIRWEQRLASDSPHCYWSGATVWTGETARHKVSAALGGKPVSHKVKLHQSFSDMPLEPRRWYRFALHVTLETQSLRVAAADQPDKALVELSARQALPAGKYHLGFFHCLDRFEAMHGDAFAQDRGAAQFAHLEIQSPKIVDAEYWPPAPPVPVVYNRRTRWLDWNDGVENGVIAFEAAGDLWLTGTSGASSWVAQRPGLIRDADATRTTFTHSARGPCEARLRAFQWDVQQHPKLELSVEPTNAEWSLLIAVTNNYVLNMPTLFNIAPTTQTKSIQLDMLQLWRDHDYETRYAEVDIALKARPLGVASECMVVFSGRLLPQEVVAVCSPVIRTAAQSASGILLQAAYVDKTASLLHQEDVAMEARIEQQRLPMSEGGRSGIFRAQIAGLPVGVYSAEIIGRRPNGLLARAKARIRIVSGSFVEKYSAERRCYVLSDGTPLGPLLGDLYAWTPFIHFGQPRQEMLCGYLDYLAKAKSAGLPVQLVKQRALTRRELTAYLDYLARSGVRVIRLTPNVSVREEFLDAGGAVAMRGLEQLHILLEEAARCDLKVLVNLFHYPYASPSIGGHPPVARYYEAGYAGPRTFTDVAVRPLLLRYLGQLLTTLQNDDTVLGYSITGENDQSFGESWINDMYDFIRRCAPHHLVTLEQGGAIQHCKDRDPWAYDGFKPTKSAGLGYRTYYPARWKSDCYINVCARFFSLNRPSFLAEAAAGFNPSLEFRTAVRDNVWTSFLMQQPLSLMWCSCPFESERLIPGGLARKVNWATFHRRKPTVAIRIYRPDDQQIDRMIQYEEALSRLALEYDYVWGDAPPQGYAFILDARLPYREPILPNEVLYSRRLEISGGSAATLLENEENTLLIAYIRNILNYTNVKGLGVSGEHLQRQPTRSRPVHLVLKNLPGARIAQVWNLDENKQVENRTFSDTTVIELGNTCHDFALFVTRP